MELIKNITSDKLRGGFYTPPTIASFILKWGINGKLDSDILEPSCGDGVFLRQLAIDERSYNTITAVEFDKAEASKAASIQVNNSTVINEDFHLFCNTTQQRFDLVVGNPPYIRYQYFKKEQQDQAELLFKNAGLKYSKLTNAWVSFIVGSSLLLNETGKIGFVIPAELLQVSYAKQLRQFLAHFYNKINIISFKKLVFEGIQQEVILLLCEKSNCNDHYIEHIEVNDAEDLDMFDVAKLRFPTKKIDFKSNKWTYYFLEQEEICFLESVAERFNIKPFSTYANVEVGITTGANSYFTVPEATVLKYDMQKYARPMVGRSVQVESLIFTHNDWTNNIKSGANANLLVFSDSDALDLNKGAKEYVLWGEDQGINKGYKTGIRNNWFVIPSVKLSDALFIRRNNLYPKLVSNEANAYTTDTMHRVYIKDSTDKSAFIASYYNSLSFAFAEIVGRSYGGGVLELLPSEVKNIPIPYKETHKELLSKVDSMMRSKTSIDAILSVADNIILKEGFGLSEKEIKIANSIWKKLSNRRLNRS